jgi:hypothetical protein
MSIPRLEVTSALGTLHLACHYQGRQFNATLTQHAQDQVLIQWFRRGSDQQLQAHGHTHEEPITQLAKHMVWLLIGKEPIL